MHALPESISEKYSKEELISIFDGLLSESSAWCVLKKNVIVKGEHCMASLSCSLLSILLKNQCMQSFLLPKIIEQISMEDDKGCIERCVDYLFLIRDVHVIYDSASFIDELMELLDICSLDLKRHIIKVIPYLNMSVFFEELIEKMFDAVKNCREIVSTVVSAFSTFRSSESTAKVTFANYRLYCLIIYYQAWII